MSEPDILISPLHLRLSQAEWKMIYALIFDVMHFFLACVAEKLIMEHDVLPSNSLV